jgi:hypothetical protein
VARAEEGATGGAFAAGVLGAGAWAGGVSDVFGEPATGAALAAEGDTAEVAGFAPPSGLGAGVPTWAAARPTPVSASGKATQKAAASRDDAVFLPRVLPDTAFDLDIHMGLTSSLCKERDGLVNASRSRRRVVRVRAHRYFA